MTTFLDRHLVLVIDLDGDEARVAGIREKIPAAVQDRVYVLGVFHEPENLKTELQANYSEIGEKLAAECRAGTRDLWNGRLLAHNAVELDRLNRTVRGILFPAQAPTIL